MVKVWIIIGYLPNSANGLAMHIDDKLNLNLFEEKSIKSIVKSQVAQRHTCCTLCIRIILYKECNKCDVGLLW